MKQESLEESINSDFQFQETEGINTQDLYKLNKDFEGFEDEKILEAFTLGPEKKYKLR
jgi:hypothetical protein